MTTKTAYNLDDTYWNGNGSLQAVSDKLHTMIPNEGSVSNPDDNSALETFRVASNCYYDLYNNGLCNRAKKFRRVFGFAGGFRTLDDAKVQRIERRMTDIIVAAAREQGVTNTSAQPRTNEPDTPLSEMSQYDRDKLLFSCPKSREHLIDYAASIAERLGTYADVRCFAEELRFPGRATAALICSVMTALEGKPDGLNLRAMLLTATLDAQVNS